jgi:putative ABC transport system substrate-binding protein
MNNMILGANGSINRRQWIAGLILMSVYPGTVQAQRSPARIGFLGAGSLDSSSILVDAVKAGLSENNLADKLDYVFDAVWAEGAYARFPALAKELAERGPALVFGTTISAVQAMQKAAPQIPIVMTSVNDPVGSGLVSSLAHPGGRVTGIASLNQDFTPKLIEILHELVPTARACSALLNPANPSNQVFLDNIRQAAVATGLTFRRIDYTGHRELAHVFATSLEHGPDALVVMPDAAFFDVRELVATKALQHKIPVFSTYPELTAVGGLASYGASRLKQYRRAAHFAAKILRGTKPSDLPVEQPTAVELGINRKTADALGLTVPPMLLALADEVIE